MSRGFVASAFIAALVPAAVRAAVLQFDLGYGTFATSTTPGANSPAHQDSTVAASQTTWNQAGTSDVLGQTVKWSDGTNLSGVGYDVGANFTSSNNINWAAGWSGTTTGGSSGVFATAPGKTGIRRASDFGAIRITGLDAGKYRVYWLRAGGHASETYRVQIGASLPSWSDTDAIAVAASDDDADWEAGSDYVAAEVTLAAGQHLTVITRGVDVPAIADDTEARMGGLQIVPIPEPSSIGVVGSAIAPFLAGRRRK